MLNRIDVTEISVERAGEGLDEVVTSRTAILSEERKDVGAARSR